MSLPSSLSNLATDNLVPVASAAEATAGARCGSNAANDAASGWREEAPLTGRCQTYGARKHALRLAAEMDGDENSCPHREATGSSSDRFIDGPDAAIADSAEAPKGNRGIGAGTAATTAAAGWRGYRCCNK
jgi:hypothetical protein